MITQSLSFSFSVTDDPSSLLNTAPGPPGSGWFTDAVNLCIARLSPFSAAFLYQLVPLRKHGYHRHRQGKRTHSDGFAGVPMPTSKKYPTAYIALARPASAAFWAQRKASVSD